MEPRSRKELGMSPTVRVSVCLLLCFLHTAVAQDCSQPCDCPSEPPLCAVGTSLVLDECGCCKVCAGQVGDRCSLLEPCDHHKQLYCHYGAEPGANTGVCMAREGQTCDLGGVIYRSGESFQPSCRHQCVCMDGEIGCVPTCGGIARLPSPDCPYPRRIHIPGRCCEEWVCDRVPEAGHFQSAVGTTSTGTYREAPDYDLSSESARENCIVQTTAWSKCSTTCGMGISTRVTNDNERCQLEKQSRVCMVRPCQALPEIAVKKGKKCLRTPRAEQGLHFELSGCSSVRLYKPRFCGTCTDGRCCTPQSTITGDVEFKCPEGDSFHRKMMFIKTCACHRDCPRDNDIFLSTSRRWMSGDYDNDM